MQMDKSVVDVNGSMCSIDCHGMRILLVLGEQEGGAAEGIQEDVLHNGLDFCQTKVVTVWGRGVTMEHG